MKPAVLLRLAALLLAMLVFPGMSTADKYTLALSEDVEVEIRRFQATGNELLLGFACDEGASINEEATAIKLSRDGLEVWMPDLLSAFFLPKLPSSIAEIPADATADIVLDAAKSTGKSVYLIAGGVETALVLRTIAELERRDSSDVIVGAILLFPRLLRGEPQPGHEPEYVDAVGGTRSPLLVIEGERTPNRWGLPHLQAALSAGGSPVQTLVVPEIRGFFYSREDSNPSEETVTTQMHGLIKAGLFQLRSDS